jgi:hypothetical protein
MWLSYIYTRNKTGIEIMIKLTDLLIEDSSSITVTWARRQSGVEFIQLRGVPQPKVNKVVTALNKTPRKSNGYFSASKRALTGVIDVLYANRDGGDEQQILNTVNRVLK